MAELLVAARRTRPAGGHFHLLAQMKVTKAKGLNTIWLLQVAEDQRRLFIAGDAYAPLSATWIAS